MAKTGLDEGTIHQMFREAVAAAIPSARGNVGIKFITYYISTDEDEYLFFFKEFGNFPTREVIRRIPRQHLLSGTANDFANGHLSSIIAEMFPPEPKEEEPKATRDSFADAPVSLNTVRSEREGDGSLWSFRDMLVETLRKIDSGDEAYQDISVAVLMFKRGKGCNSFGRWDAAGPDYDQVSAAGLITYTLHHMMSL
jgi:hypothetical protein